MELVDKYITISPEGVEIEQVLAGLGSRFLAILVDTVIQLCAVLAFITVFSALAGSFSSQSSWIPALIIGFLIVSLLFIYFGYFIFFEILGNGKSVGKLLTGIKVVSIDGSPVTFRRSTLRNLVRIIDYLPNSYLLGAISIFATKHHQRIGDLVAGTIVIRERIGGFRPMNAQSSWQDPSFWFSHTNTVPYFSAPVSEADLWDLSQITSNDIETINRFLERRWALPIDVRQKLARDIAAFIYSKTFGVSPTYAPEHFLELVSLAKSQKLSKIKSLN